MMAELKRIVVIGCSYVGAHVAQQLASRLHATHYVVAIEAKSHFEHLFVSPRFSTPALRGLEHKAFVPFTGTFSSAPKDAGEVVQARVTAFDDVSVSLDRPVRTRGINEPTTRIPYDFLVLATGTRDPGTGAAAGIAENKADGITLLQRQQAGIDRANRIVLLGGGATGCQLACDLAQLYPSKQITMVHSRDQLMNRFHPELSNIVKDRFKELGVQTVLGERVVFPSGGYPTDGQTCTTINFQSGKTLECDLALVCTGQAPASGLVAQFQPSAIDAQTGYVRIQPSLQLADGPGNIFVLGDVAHTGSAKAARPAMAQAAVVVNNIEKLVNKSTASLDTYQADAAGIHLTLGIEKSIIFRMPNSDRPNPEVLDKDDGTLDMNIDGFWTRRGVPVEGRDYRL